jgi:hypothetical protein
VAALSGRLLLYADDLAEQSRRLRGLETDLASGPWHGEAAVSFGRRLDVLPGQLGTVSEAFFDAGEALRVFGQRLALAQDDARALRRQADLAAVDLADAEGRAYRRLAAAEAELAADPSADPVAVLRRHGLHPSPRADLGLFATSTVVGGLVRLTTTDWDAADARLRRCRTDAHALRERVDHHGRTAAGIVAAAASTAFGRSDGWLPDWVEGVVDDVAAPIEWLSEAAGSVSTICGLLSLVTVWCPPLSGALATASIATGLVAMAGHVAMWGAGHQDGSAAMSDALGVATGGLGRVLGTAADAARAGASAGRAWSAGVDDLGGAGLLGELNPVTWVRTTVRDLRDFDVMTADAVVRAEFSGGGSRVAAAYNAADLGVGVIGVAAAGRGQAATEQSQASQRRAALRSLTRPPRPHAQVAGA